MSVQYGQPKHWSLIESLVNIAVGFGVAYFATLLIFPYFGFNVDPNQDLWITVIFTAISMVRSYILRRLFNRIKYVSHP